MGGGITVISLILQLLMIRNKELEEQGVKQREEIKVLEKGKGRLKEQYEGMRNQARVLQGEKFKHEEAKQEAQVISFS